MHYNHFDYMEQVARQLKPVGHTDAHRRYLTAYGLEDLYNIDDRLSDLRDYVLIAVDGYESDMTMNGADGLTDVRQYGVIICHHTQTDRTETIDNAFQECSKLCLQVRNRLLCDAALRPYLGAEWQLNGIGPIGDGFYGCLLSFSMADFADYNVNPELWEG